MYALRRFIAVAPLLWALGCSTAAPATPSPTMSIVALNVNGGVPLTVDLEHLCDSFVHVYFHDELLVFRTRTHDIRFSVSEFRESVTPRDWHFSEAILPDKAYSLFEDLAATRPGCVNQATYVLLDASLLSDGTVLKDMILLSQRFHTTPVMLTSGPGAPLEEQVVTPPSAEVFTAFDRAIFPVREMRLSVPTWWVEVGAQRAAVKFTVEQLLLRGVTCVNGPWYTLPPRVSEGKFSADDYSHQPVPPLGDLPAPLPVNVNGRATVHVMAFVGWVSVLPPGDVKVREAGHYYVARIVANQVCGLQGIGVRRSE